MLHTHPALREPGAGMAAAAAWVRHCRMWQPAIAAHRPRRRIYWLSLPLDDRATAAPADTVAGRDKDTDAALADYRARAAELIGALPGAFFPKPVSAEQIWWHWNYTASRGVWQPPAADRSATIRTPACPARRSPPCNFDPAAAQLRGRRWRAARADADVFVRTFRDAADGVPDSYQALIPLDSFPDTGIAWPRATIFKVLDDLTGTGHHAGLDDPHHLHLRRLRGVDGAERHHQHPRPVPAARPPRRLRRRTHPQTGLRQGAGLRAQTRLRRTRRQPVDRASPPPAADADTRELRCRRGDAASTAARTSGRGGGAAARPTLWRAFNPGSERSAALGEFRNPTTTERFAKFVPLLANTLGNRTGVPLGMNLTSPGLRDVVLLDLLGAPGRENPANLVICGSPGPRQVPHRQAADPVVAGAGRRRAHLRSRRAARTPTRPGRCRRSGGDRPRRSRHVHRPAADLPATRPPPNTPWITCCRCWGIRR